LHDFIVNIQPDLSLDTDDDEKQEFTPNEWASWLVYLIDLVGGSDVTNDALAL